MGDADQVEFCDLKGAATRGRRVFFVKGFMMNKMAILSIGAALAVGISACAPEVKTEAVKSELTSMPVPADVTGDVRVWKVGDKQLTITTVSAGPGSASFDTSEGCKWSSQGGFSPSIAWADCPGFSNGSQTITKNDKLAELAVGNTAVWMVDGRNDNGDNWSNTRKCSVEGTARVTVPAGSFDTFHVICDNGSTKRDYYVSPELGTTVLFKRFRRNRNETEIQELISFTPGSV